MTIAGTRDEETAEGTFNLADVAPHVGSGSGSFSATRTRPALAAASVPMRALAAGVEVLEQVEPNGTVTMRFASRGRSPR
jgi:hypothetical protein